MQLRKYIMGWLYKIKHLHADPANPNMPLWEAIIFVLEKGKVPKDWYCLNVSGHVRELGMDGRMGVWVKKAPSQKDFIKLTKAQLRDSFISIQGSDPIGSVWHHGDGTVWHNPTVCKEEIEEEFFIKRVTEEYPEGSQSQINNTSADDREDWVREGR